jgi:hypothetical protein
MDIPRGDDGFGSRAADTRLARDAIAAAILRADGAATQNIPGGGSAFGQFARFIEVKIAGIEHDNFSVKKKM